MREERLDLSLPIAFGSEEERVAAIAFFNAAYRAEESGLRQAHELSGEVGRTDPALAECLRLYGDEEGWHRELLMQFLVWLGAGVKPMGPTTRMFYRLYGRAKRMDSIVLVNLMFETMGSTTYRLALRGASRPASHPAVRHMLTILTRDESFHVPLNVHFLRAALDRSGARESLRLRAIHDATFLALVASTGPSRRRAGRFDGIPRDVLARAYAAELSRLFLEESDLGLAPSRLSLWAFGLKKGELLDSPSPVSIEAAERSVEREGVGVEAY